MAMGNMLVFFLNVIVSRCEIFAASGDTVAENGTGVQFDNLWSEVVQRVKQQAPVPSDTEDKCGTRDPGPTIACRLEMEVFKNATKHEHILLAYNPDKVKEFMTVSPANTTKSESCTSKPHFLEEPTHQGHLDLQGVQLRVITDPFPPYIIKRTHANGSHYVTGFSIDLLEEVRQMLNFTYVLEYEHDGWGHLYEDGNWSDMVGLLQRRERDLLIGCLGYQPERTAVMDFSLVYDEMSVTMWMLDPRKRPRIWMAMFDMLDLAVTGILLGTVCLLSAILTASSMTVPTGHPPESVASCFVTKVFTLLGAILAQGSRVQPATSTGKIVIAFWWIFSVVFSVTYSAMLIATLSANTTNLPFDSVTGMLKQTEYSYGIFGSGTEQMYFQEITNSSVYQKLWRNIERAAITDPGVLSSDYRVHGHRVTHERYVFIGTNIAWDDFADAQTSVISFGDEFYRLKICFGLQLNSPYTSPMSHSLAVLLQHGIVSKLKKKWFSSTSVRPTELSDVNPIALSTLTGVFFTAAIGLVISLITLLLEIGISRLKHRRGNRNED